MCVSSSHTIHSNSNFQDALLFQILGRAAERAVGVLRIPDHRVPKYGSKQLKAIEEARTELAEKFVKVDRMPAPRMHSPFPIRIVHLT